MKHRWTFLILLLLLLPVLALPGCRSNNRYLDAALELYDPQTGWKPESRTQAESRLKQAELSNPLSPDPVYYLGNLYLNQARSMESRKLREAEKKFRQVLGIDPVYGPAYLGLGDIYCRMGQYQRGEKYYRLARVYLNKPQAANLRLASSLLEQRRYAESLAVYKDEWAENPQYIQPILGMAAVYLESRRYRQAEKYYRLAYKLNPRDPYLHLGLGQLYQELEALPQAQNEYRQVLEYSPDDSYTNFREKALVYLGQIELEENRFKTAEDYFNQALKLNPESEHAHAGLGEICLRRDDLDGAAREYRLALLVDPISEFGLLGMAEVNRRSGYYPQAQDFVERALKINPDSETGWLLLGELQLIQNRPDQARESLKKVLALEGEDFLPGQYLQVKLLLKEKKPEEAKKLFKKLLKADPSYREKAEKEKLSL